MINSNASSRITAVLLVLLGGNVWAQETATPAVPFELNGYFDFYYQNSPQAHISAPGSLGPYVLQGRSFDSLHNQMTLNMVELSVKKKMKSVSFSVELSAGQMVDVLAGNGDATKARDESTRNITQATLTYTPAQVPNLSLTAGKFYSFLGAEVTRAKDNWQYSRSYAFNFGIPFWHEGLNITYGWIPSKLNTSLYLLNAWDGRINQEANRSATVGFNLNLTPIESLIANYNYIGGMENPTTNRREVHEINAVYTLNPAWALAMDVLQGSEKSAMASGEDAKWRGYSLYLKYSPVAWYTLSPRFEVFDDSDQGYALSGFNTAPTTGKQKINSWTVSNNFSLGDGLETRIEIRTDRASDNGYFIDKDGSATDHQESYTFAILWSL